MHRYSKRMFLVFLLASSFIIAFCYAVFCVVSGRFSVFQVIVCFFCSLVAVFCASLLQTFLSSFNLTQSILAQRVFSAFIQAALIEEMAKLFFIWILFVTLFKQKTCSSFLSGALLFALFFSSFETVAYGISSPDIIVIRSLTALPLHGAATVLAASTLYPCNSKKVFRFLPIVIAVLGHGLFTFSMDTGNLLILGLVSLLGLVGSAFWYTTVYKENEGSRN